MTYFIFVPRESFLFLYTYSSSKDDMRYSALFAKPNTVNSQADVMLFLRYSTLEDLQELLTD